MKIDTDAYDFLSNFSTIGAIVLGSILATAGALIATQVEWRVERRRREQQAALFFGEVLSSMLALLRVARRVKGIGDPYGPVTLRLLRQALQEIGIYDRNRENLYNLQDAQVRVRIHTLVLRISSPLNGILDATEEIRATQRAKAGLAPTHLDDPDAHAHRLAEMREAAFEFMEKTALEVETLVKDLERIAGHAFVEIAARA